MPTRLDTLSFDNSFARLPDAFYTRLKPWGLPEPHAVITSRAAAALIDLPREETTRAEFVDAFAGNTVLPGSEPLAAVYGGHQFGIWAGQLGDGRAHLLGEVRSADGPWELQLKGAGRTPYSRHGDGRAVLASSIREFLCSEAMAALGIPTTRALTLVGSALPVMREQPEAAAVLTRMSPTFVRFGSFEYWFAEKRMEALQTLADYVIDRFYPDARASEDPLLAMLTEVSARTAALITQWQAVGFMHGVMNTDNMSILGLTLDYGPFGFMEAFDAEHICNQSDHAGRYRYSQQPRVALWNLQVLGHALRPLIHNPDAVKDAIDEAFAATYNGRYLTLMRAKLGLAQRHAGDEALIGALYDLLQSQRCDYPLFFRRLGALPARPEDGADATIHALCADRAACDAWLAQWRTRLVHETRDDAARRTAMDAVNPAFVLRNWMAESATHAAREGDFGELHAIHDCLQQPFSEQPDFARFAAPAPDWARTLTVSCSS